MTTEARNMSLRDDDDRRVYADQWKSAAAALRAKAAEFDELARSAPLRPLKPENVVRAIVNARSFVDLARGSHFPDEFVLDMAKCLKEVTDLLDSPDA